MAREWERLSPSGVNLTESGVTFAEPVPLAGNPVNPWLTPMAAPPTLGALIAATGIATGINWSPFVVGQPGVVNPDDQVSYVGVAAETNGLIYPDYGYVFFGMPSHPNAPSAGYRARFWWSGLTSSLEIGFKNYNNLQYQLYVNGSPVAAAPVTVNGAPGLAILPITFAAPPGPTLIEFVSALPWGGVRTALVDTIWRPVELPAPRLAVISDSYGGGTGALGPGITGYPQILAALLGAELWSHSVGGSGYLNGGSGVPFRNRLNELMNPDIVLVQGLHNDTGFAPNLIAKEAAALFTALRASFPKAKLVCVGPLGAPNAQATYAAIQAAVFPAVAGIADLTIDTVTFPWFTGTGFVGTTNGSGPDDFWISADNVHPSQAGHLMLAHRLCASITNGLFRSG